MSWIVARLASWGLGKVAGPLVYGVLALVIGGVITGFWLYHKSVVDALVEEKVRSTKLAGDLRDAAAETARLSEHLRHRARLEVGAQLVVEARHEAPLVTSATIERIERNLSNGVYNLPAGCPEVHPRLDAFLDGLRSELDAGSRNGDQGRAVGDSPADRSAGVQGAARSTTGAAHR
jgi:hypothetical protein